MNNKIKCDKCKGKGVLDERYDLRTTDTGKVWMTTKMCLNCHGEGELDWIENIVGKNPNEINFQLKLQAHKTTEWGPNEEV